MRTREDGDLETIRAAHQFVARHDELRAVRETGAYRNLGEFLDDIEQQSVNQASEAMAGQGATQTARAAREDLIVHHMNPIAAIARYLETDYPGLRAVRLPKTYRGATALISHATAMATEGTKYEELFVKQGLPEDFVAELHAAVTRFRMARAQPRQHRAARSGATEGARTGLAQAKKWLNVIDSFVMKAAVGNTSLIAEWKAVKRYPRRKQAQGAVAAQDAETPALPLMLPAGSATPIDVTTLVPEELPAKQPARWTLRGLFRT